MTAFDDQHSTSVRAAVATGVQSASPRCFSFLQAQDRALKALHRQLSAARDDNAGLQVRLQQRQTEWKAASLQAAEVSSALSYLMWWPHCHGKLHAQHQCTESQHYASMHEAC